MGDEKYTDRGHRGEDPRHGFGDDMGTRVGAPDGAREVPRDAGGQRPGQPSTNADEVADGLEGSIMNDEGSEQRRVRGATGGGDVNADANADVNADNRGTGKDRPVHDL
jgi:hypothetical protein